MSFAIHALKVCFALFFGCSGKTILQNRIIGPFFPIFFLHILYKRHYWRWFFEFLHEPLYLWAIFLYIVLFYSWKRLLFKFFCIYFTICCSLTYFLWKIVLVFSSSSSHFFPMFIELIVLLCYFGFFMFGRSTPPLLMVSSLCE